VSFAFCSRWFGLVWGWVEGLCAASSFGRSVGRGVVRGVVVWALRDLFALRWFGAGVGRGVVRGVVVWAGRDFGSRCVGLVRSPVSIWMPLVGFAKIMTAFRNRLRVEVSARQPLARPNPRDGSRVRGGAAFFACRTMCARRVCAPRRVERTHSLRGLCSVCCSIICMRIHVCRRGLCTAPSGADSSTLDCMRGVLQRDLHADPCLPSRFVRRADWSGLIHSMDYVFGVLQADQCVRRAWSVVASGAA
jgi:hypothetical protein